MAKRPRLCVGEHTMLPDFTPGWRKCALCDYVERPQTVKQQVEEVVVPVSRYGLAIPTTFTGALDAGHTCERDELYELGMAREWRGYRYMTPRKLFEIADGESAWRQYAQNCHYRLVIEAINALRGGDRAVSYGVEESVVLVGPTVPAAEMTETASLKQPRPFIIREEVHPLKPGESVFRVYTEDMRPLYMGRDTVEEAEAELRQYEPVSEITVVYREQLVALSISPDLGAHWHRERVYRLAYEQGWKGLVLEGSSALAELRIADGESAWRHFAETASFQRIIAAMNVLQRAKEPVVQPVHMVSVSADRAERERLLQRARACDWPRLSFVPASATDPIVIGGGPQVWATFGQNASHDHVVQAGKELEKQYPRRPAAEITATSVDPATGLCDQPAEPLSVSEAEMRARMLAYAEGLEWIRISYKSANATYMVGPGKEEWRKFAERGAYGRVVDVCAELERRLQAAPEEMPQHHRTTSKRARAELKTASAAQTEDGEVA